MPIAVLDITAIEHVQVLPDGFGEHVLVKNVKHGSKGKEINHRFSAIVTTSCSPGMKLDR